MNKPIVKTPGGPDDVAPIQDEIDIDPLAQIPAAVDEITNAEVQTFWCRLCDIEMTANEMRDSTKKEIEKIVRSQIKVLKSLGLLE
jgi:hypothetical protein